MTKETPQTEASYTLTMDRRRTMTLTGVTDVESFDDQMVVLHTHGGRLVISGSGLHVSGLTLEDGRLTLDGAIDSAAYDAPEGARRSWLRRRGHA